MLVCFGYLAHYATNVPYMDDMELVYTINDLHEAEADPVSILFRQQNDHRVFFSRLAASAVFFTKGVLDFRWVILLGLGSLGLLFYTYSLLLKSNTTDGGDKIDLLVSSLLLFSGYQFGGHLWSITAFQYTLSLAFSFLAFYWLFSTRRSGRYLAFLFGMAASLTTLDGLLVFLLGLAWLLAQRRFYDALRWLVLSVGWFWLFLRGFRFSRASVLPHTPDDFLRVIKGFVAFMGSYMKLFSDTYAMPLVVVVGGILLTAVIALLVGLWVRKGLAGGWAVVRSDLLSLCFVRVVAAAAMIALGRSLEAEGAVLGIRFQVYAVTVVVLFYGLLVGSVSTKFRGVVRGAALSVALLGCILGYGKYDAEVSHRVSSLKADTYNYTHRGVFLHQYFHLPDPPPSFYRYYRFPVFFTDDQLAALQPDLGEAIPFTLEILRGAALPQDYTYAQYQLSFEWRDPFATKSLWVSLSPVNAPGVRYLLSARPVQSGLRSFWARLKSVFVEGLDFPVRCRVQFPAKLPAGTYRVRVLDFQAAKAVPLAPDLVVE